jgi:serine/threonine protein kinase
MELVEGRSLTELLAGGALPTEQALRYGATIADALDHAHSRGIVHRDLKNANVVISPRGPGPSVSGQRIPTIPRRSSESSDLAPV